MYAEWAQAHSDRIRDVLNAAREDHKNAVKRRIENVKDLSGVIDITKALFEVSKVRGIIISRHVWLHRRGQTNTGLRKRLNWRPKATNSSKRLLLPARQKPFWIHGFGTKVK